MFKISSSFKRVAFAAATLALAFSAPMAQADTLGTTGYQQGSQSFNLSLNGNGIGANTGGFAGTWNASSIVFWCIELTQNFGFGGNYTDYVASEPNNATFTQLGQLFTEAFGASTSDAMHSAAFQLAIWEIVYDPGLDLGSGDFKVVGGDAQTIALAQGWLDALGQYSDNYHLIMLHSAEHQDFVTFGRPFGNVTQVPEPAPLALLAAALLAMVAVGRGRKQGRNQA